jgi:hypothetical protein
MLNNAGIKEEMRRGIWVTRESGKPTQELMIGVKVKKLSNLKRFGEMVVIATNKKNKES